MVFAAFDPLLLTGWINCSVFNHFIGISRLIGQMVEEMWLIRFFKMAGVRHLGFSNSGNFNSWLVAEVPDASPCQILSKSVKWLWRYGNFSIFLKMAAVSHLGFVGRILGHPLGVLGGLYHFCQNLIWIYSLVFTIRRFQYFVHLAGKCIFKPPKLRFWGYLTPVNGDQHQRNFQQTHSCMESRRMTYRSVVINCRFWHNHRITTFVILRWWWWEIPRGLGLGLGLVLAGHYRQFITN